MINTDINPELQKYLEEQEQRRLNMQQPEYMSQQLEHKNEDFEAARAPQEVATYAKAFSQLGTLNGKAAGDTSSLDENAKQINKVQGQQRQQDMLDQDQRDKDTGLNLKTLEYLQTRGDKAQDIKRQETRDTVADTRARDLAQMSSDRAYGLASMQDKRARELAEFNADKSYKLAEMRGEFNSKKDDSKNDLNLAKRFTEFGKDLNEGLASGRSDLGQHQKMVSAADRVLQLGEQGKSQPGGLDKRQIHELAIASANLVSSGGTGAAQSTIEALVPKSIQGDAAGIAEWLAGSPQGSHQQEFVSRMLDTAEREKFLASEKIKGIKGGVLQMYGDLKQRDPDRYGQFIKSNFGENPQFDPNGKYVYQQFKGGSHEVGKPEADTAYAASAQKMPNAGKIKVVSPEGETGWIPKENLEKALQRNFKQVE